MTRLPERGEIFAAQEALNERLQAVCADVNEAQPFGELGSFQVVADGSDVVDFGGSGVPPTLRMYGDLFIVDKAMLGGAPVVRSFALQAIRGEMDIESAFGSTYLQGMAIGVLMERRRWETGRSS